MKLGPIALAWIKEARPMRIFDLNRSGAQLTKPVLPARQITPADAKLFLTYQPTDKVAETVADYLAVDLDDLHKLRVNGDGEVYYVVFNVHRQLTDIQLMEVALTMGWRDWVQPIYEPLPTMR